MFAEFTAAALRFDNRLITAGPEEIFFPNGLKQPAAFHHGTRILMDAGKHQRAALLAQAFMQTMYGFDAGCIDQRNAAHREDQSVCVAQVPKYFIKLTGCRKE